MMRRAENRPIFGWGFMRQPAEVSQIAGSNRWFFVQSVASTTVILSQHELALVCPTDCSSNRDKVQAVNVNAHCLDASAAI
jgi:hypothetical protein